MTDGEIGAWTSTRDRQIVVLDRDGALARIAELEAALAALLADYDQLRIDFDAIVKSDAELAGEARGKRELIEAKLAVATAENAALRELLAAELCAANAQTDGRWQPVVDGVDCTDNMHYSIRPKGNAVVIAGYWRGDSIRLVLDSGIRLCRLIPAAAQEAQDGE